MPFSGRGAVFFYMNFFDSFNQSLVTAQAVMGEDWILDGKPYKAIAIDALTAEERATMGGRFKDVNTSVTVALEIFTSSGVKQGSVITVRGEALRVANVQNEGDAARTLICGPVGVDMPRR